MFTNEQLAEVAKARCTTPGDLGKIDGIGPARLEKYGADLLAALLLARGHPRGGAGQYSRGHR